MNAPELPSLDAVRAELDALLAEQERRGAAFDSRAGLILGFGAVLISLSPNDPTLLLLIGQALAAIAAGLAVWSLRPRVAGAISPRQLRDRYLTRELDETKLAVLDTRIDLYERDEARLETKADPELIGNIEGNDRVRDQDRASARAYLKRHDLTSPADDADVRRHA